MKKQTGVCHSDCFAVYGAMGNTFPRAPGHEVIGDIIAVGEDVAGFSVGQRVAIGSFIFFSLQLFFLFLFIYLFFDLFIYF